VHRDVLAAEARLQLGLQRGEELVAVLKALLLDLRPQVVEEVLGGLDADIGPDERLFDLVPGVLVDLAAPGQGADHPASLIGPGERSRNRGLTAGSLPDGGPVSLDLGR
jgi:hypothetical protein